MSGKGRPASGTLLPIEAAAGAGDAALISQGAREAAELARAGAEDLTDVNPAMADANAAWWLQCRRVRLLALACRRQGSDPRAAYALADRLAAFCDASTDDGGDLRLECLSAVIDLLGRGCMGGDPIELAEQFEAFALGRHGPAPSETGGAAEAQS